MDTILVTGANGFIGSKVVQTLLDRGSRNIRCLVRSINRMERLDSIFARYGMAAQDHVSVGDLRSAEDCKRITANVSIIYHLAASFDKSFDRALLDSAVATRNLLQAFATNGSARRFVHVSSFAVYSNFGMKRNALIDESSPLEDSPYQRCDAYGLGKLKQEEIVREIGRTDGIPFVILRPGTVFGPGKRDLTGRIGISVGKTFIHVGGSNILPLTYVDNCAEAVVMAGTHPGIEGETFNVVDDDLLTSRQFLRAYRERVGGFITLPLPYSVAFVFCSLAERLAKLSSKLPRSLNQRRCSAEWKGNRFSNRKLRETLRWSPRVPMPVAMKAFLDQFDPTT